MLIMQKKIGTGIGTPTPSTTTKMLIHADGDSLDATTNGNNLVLGLASLTSSDPKFGTQSIVGGGITALSGTDFDFGTGEFTIDMWLKTTTNQQRLFSSANTVDYWVDTRFSNNVIRLHLNNAQVGQGTTSLIDNQWHHFALTRIGDTFTVYIDGTAEIIYAAPTNFVWPANEYMHHGSAAQWSGQTDEIRILKGEAAYTANFTPPTLPYIVV